MGTIVKVQRKGQVTIPTRLRAELGLVDGALVEARAHRGRIVLTPKIIVDREYTPAQRRMIDAELDKAARGPFHGPFSTANEMIAHMKGELRKRTASKTKRSR